MTPDLKAAQGNFFNSQTVFLTAKKEFEIAAAIFCGLNLLEYHAATWPGVTGYYYETTNEYDDERYFDASAIRPVIDETIEGHEQACEDNGAPEEDYDNLEAWDQDTLEVLFGFQDETLNLEQLRARVLELSKGALGSDPNS